MGRILSQRQGNCISRHVGDALNAFSGDARKSLDDACVCRQFGPGEVIFHQGDDCTGIHCVGTGLVGLRKYDTLGRSMLVKLASPGDVLGYQFMSATGEQPYTAEAMVTTAVCFTDGAAMRRVLEQFPAIGIHFLHRAAAELEEAEEKMLNYAALPVHLRLAHILVELIRHTAAEVRHGAFEMTIPISRSDIAGMVGASPESISRAVHRLENDGYVRFSGPFGRHLSIPDLDALIDQVEASDLN